MAKKTLAIFLSLMLLVGLLVGCGGKEGTKGTTAAPTGDATYNPDESREYVEENGVKVYKTGYPVVKESITVVGMMPDNQRKPYNDNKTAVWLEEKTGIKIDMNTIASDVYQEKMNIAFAGGDYPDFFYMADMLRNQMTMYGRDSGYLIDLKPLIEDGWASNLKVFLDKDPDIYRVCLIDGALYCLPFIMNGLNEPNFYINRAWMEATGKGMPKSLDEFTELLRAFKTQDPNKNGEADEIPIASAGNVNWYNPLITCFGLASIGWLEDENGQVYHGVTTENYKDFLRWSRMAYQEGLIDQRMPTSKINDEKIIADMYDGKVGMFYAAHLYAFPPEIAEQYMGFVPFGYGGSDKGVWPGPITCVQGTFCITDKCKFPRAMMRWIDYYGYTEEGSLMMDIGKEGETFEIAADGSIAEINRPEGMTSDEYRNTWCLQGYHYYPGFYNDFMMRHSKDPIVKIVREAREALVPITIKAISDYNLTTEESEEISVISTELSDYITTSEVKFIIGEMDVERDWDAFQNELIKIGIEKDREVRQRAVDRFYGK